MNAQSQKITNRQRRTNRVRSQIIGSAKRPRLAIFISNSHITAQVINDADGKTLAYATSVGQKVEGAMSAKAEWVGRDIARKAKKAKVSQVVFDRHGRKYHGRLKVLADSARDEGLEF
jgi:large subunit ribosomal protein L18